MQILFRPEAQKEVQDAQAWYEARAEGLGDQFASAVEAAVAAVVRSPAAFPQLEAEFRQILLRKFPYSLIYHGSDDELVVVSCFHHRRRPGSWRPSES